MLTYPKRAVTSKTISRFNYELYASIGVNMLKYNHDSSTIFRLFAALCDDTFGIIEDLGYQPRFSLRYIEFTSIDRVRKFSMRSIPDVNFVLHNYDTAASDYIIGYSKYTGREYTLELIENENDFARHSMPCDLFLSGSLTHNHSDTYEIAPYMKTPIGANVENSQVTIEVLGGVSLFTKDGDNLVTVRIYGKDSTYNDIEEDIVILDNLEYVTELEFIFIDYMMVIGNNANITVKLCPYINSEKISWNQMYVDREDFEEYRSAIHVDQLNNSIIISKVMELATEYPNMLEAVESIRLNTVTKNEVITTYFIDTDNKLLYTSTNEEVNLTTVNKRFYCYPLIFPYNRINTLESKKTGYQSLKVEYKMDTINKECTFYIFPSERHNGIESLNISINSISNKDNYPSWSQGMLYFKGDEVAFDGNLFTCIVDHLSSETFDISGWRPNTYIYSEGILLDLYRESIETNRIVIPFSDLFIGDSTSCIVEFSTYGDNESLLPIYLYDLTLDYLFAKTLDELAMVWTDSKPSEETWLIDSDTSTFIEYREAFSGGLGYGEGTYGGEATTDNIIPIGYGGIMTDGISGVFLYKLTNFGNLCINDSTIVNVFNTFVYSDADNSITLSDTITAVRGSSVEV